MALPPEHLSAILVIADLVVEAEVVAADECRDDAPIINAPDNWVDVGRMAGSQTVRLRVVRTLRGEKPPANIEAKKPIAPSQLWNGVQGPFLLAKRDDEWLILGRYGPLYRSTAEVESVLSSPEGRLSD